MSAVTASAPAPVPAPALPRAKAPPTTTLPATEIPRLSREARDALFAELGSCAERLTTAEADAARRRFGPNDVAQAKHQGIGRELSLRLGNPLNALLLVVAVVSWVTGDARAAIVIAVMVVLSVGLGFVQEHRSNRAAEALRAMVRTTASVLRRETPGPAEVPINIVKYIKMGSVSCRCRRSTGRSSRC